MTRKKLPAITSALIAGRMYSGGNAQWSEYYETLSSLYKHSGPHDFIEVSTAVSVADRVFSNRRLMTAIAA